VLMLALTIGITYQALNISVAISVVKTLIYYLDERTWDHITLGMPS
jgi:uncharacterized membrane protein